MIKRILIAYAFIIALLLSSISYSQDNFKSFNLKGKISNNLDIHMEIKPSSANTSASDDRPEIFIPSKPEICHYRGFYYYDKYAKKITIIGSLYSGGFIYLTEFDQYNNDNGWFYGFIMNDKLIKGVWTGRSGKNYPFYLFDSKMRPEDFDLNIPMDRLGNYERINNTDNDHAELTIYADVNGKFLFDMSGQWYNPKAGDPTAPNVGLVEGIASYTNTTRTKADYIEKDISGKGDLKIHFEFVGKQVVVTANDAISEFCGAGVRLYGTFKKTK